MKKNILLSISLIFISFLSFSQEFGIKKKGNCYDKSVKRRENIKYAEWECGKRAGIVDCNEKLSYNQDNNTFTAGIDATPFNGKCETCHNNGMLERTVSFVNGKEDGIDSTTYSSGCLQVVRSHIQGVRNGTWTYLYDSTQQIAWEINYYVGKQNGRAIFFTKNGDTTLWENYKDGLQHGPQRNYYEESKLQKFVNYKDGYIDGKFITYNREGIVTQDLNYKMGIKDGEFKFYYDDGTLLRTEHWDMDIKAGEFKTFYYGGAVQDHETYKKGRLEGWAEEFYPNRKLKHKTLYKKGEVIEEYKYDQHGKETYSFGASEEDKGGAEDDDVMSGQSKKRKRKKK